MKKNPGRRERRALLRKVKREEGRQRARENEARQRREKRERARKRKETKNVQ